MFVKFCDLTKNYLEIKDEVNNNINNVLQKCNYIFGNEVKVFEKNFASYIGVKHCIGVGNGTDALEIAIKSLDLPPDSEILVQGNTYIATCLSVINNSYKLVLCDVDMSTHMININNIEKKITEKTKALILVHLYGFMPNMDKILETCKKYNLYLVEDCAQSHGASYFDKKAGSFGIISCFSFYPSKNLGAYGDGGAIVTNDDMLNEKIRMVSNLGSKIKYNYEIIGRNSRLDTIQATILDTKLKYLDSNNMKRHNIAKLYNTLLEKNHNIIIPKIENNTIPVYHLYVIRAKKRNQLQKYLLENGIETLIHYPIPLCNTILKNYIDISMTTENVIKLCDEILSLPMYPELEENDVIYVCNMINNFYKDMIITKVDNSKLGKLHCINSLNFSPVKRIFYIDGFENIVLPIKRGNHAIINFREFLIIMEGEIKMKIINKNNEIKEFILTKNDTYLIEENSWIEYEVNNNNTKIMVLCDKEYNESIFENDFYIFLNQ
jgi:dTDP-4-amino-4,6-dideoxygalactose transaminase